MSTAASNSIGFSPGRLDRLSWRAIRDLQAGGCDLLLLPVGATEQHGPHLPIRTDTLIAEAVCEAVSERTGIPVLPAVPYTVSSGHTAKWPGTFSLTHETFIAMIGEIADWCVETGWKRLLIVNSHFGNDASLRVVVEKARLRHLGRLQIGLQNAYCLNDAVWDAYTEDADDLHANKAETDLVLHLAPGEVRVDWIEDDPDRTDGTVFSHPVSQTSLNGVTGSPSLGNAADGARLFEQMVEALSAAVERARHEAPPLPASDWIHTTPSQ